MRLESLFPPTKTLATVTKTSAIQAGVSGPVAPFQRPIFKKKPVPNTCPFPITFPVAPAQKPKDYQVITTQEELKKYLLRCQETGYCSFDWETGPDDATRERWKEFTRELTYRLEAAENNPKVQKIINEEYEEYEKAYDVYLKTPLDPHRSEICCFSVAAWPNEARIVFLSMRKGTRNFMPTLSRAEARKVAFDILHTFILQNKTLLKIAFNLAFETKMATKYRMYILKPVSDPFVMAVRCRQIVEPKRILDPKKAAYNMDLKTLSKEIFGVEMTHFKDLLARKKADFFDELSTDDPEVVIYSAEDSDYGLQHHLYWKPIAEQIPNRNNVYPTYYDWLSGIEMPFSRVVGVMEYHGMAWNPEEAELKRKEAEEKILECQQEIIKLIKDTFGNTVNPGKTGKTFQVREAVFKQMGIPAVAWSEKTEDETLDNPAILNMIFLLENNLENLDEEELLSVPLPDYWPYVNVDKNTIDAGLFVNYQGLKSIETISTELRKMNSETRKRVRLAQRPPFKYREEGLKLLHLMQNIQRYTTLLSSHIKGREKYLNPVTNRIHAGYTPWTETSRLNSSKPNQQNVPQPSNDAFGIRNLYKAPPGKLLHFTDESGFELRIMAWKSGDKVMLQAFNSTDKIVSDLHSKTAMTLTGKQYHEITKPERNMAKAGNFGCNYGGTKYALQKTLLKLGIRKSLPECDKIVQAVMATYPGVLQFQKDCVSQAEDDGFTECIYGYKRLLPDINSTMRQYKNSANRAAMNTPIQGSAAEIMKRNQNEIYERTGTDTFEYDSMVSRGETPDAATGPLMVQGLVDMCGQIHDEIITEIEENPIRVIRADEWIREVMGTPPLKDFPVPMIGESAVGYRWGTKITLDQWLRDIGYEK